MKRILFLSLCKYNSVFEKDIYTDLIRALTKRGCYVVIASPLEKKYRQKPKTIKENNSEICQVLINDYFGVSSIKKGWSLLSIDRRFKNTLKKRYRHANFDLILYATPPIMFGKTISYFKKRDNAKTYLMLKDIFPQNAVDLGMMKTTGLKGLIYKYFRKQEKKLYAASDRIGCMSPANVKYVLKHNPEISESKVEVFPNCIEVQDILFTDEEKKNIRMKYKLPLDKKIFVYGGNLGKPQGIPFIIECLRAEKNNNNVFFLIVGNGTEYNKLEAYSNESKQENFKLLRRLPTDEFDRVLASCDVGLIFLDYRFTIPNFPSRLLSYMQAKLPVLACTDTTSDIGKTIVDGRFGWWCESNNYNNFCKIIEAISKENILNMKKSSFQYLNDCFSVDAVVGELIKNQ